MPFVPAKTADEIIAEYRDAYRAANGKEVFILARRGWFYVSDRPLGEPGGDETHCRRREVEQMTIRLRAMVARRVSA